MKNWYLIPSSTYISGYEDDYFQQYSQDEFQEALSTFLASELTLYQQRPELNNGKKFRGIIQNVTTDSDTSSYKKQLLCNIGTVECGNYIEYNDNYYLCIGLVDNNKIYEKAVLYQCNQMLSFIYKNELVTYPVHTSNATQYNSGITTNKNSQMVYGSSQHNVNIMCDEITKYIDHDKRFLMDKNDIHPTAYVLTQVDSTSYNFSNQQGVLVWMLRETPLNLNTDNIGNMVADFTINKDFEGWN